MDLPRVSLPRPPLQHVSAAFSRHAPTVRGQLLGLVMLITPAITHPLPLDGGLHGAVQIIAVLVGSAGMVIVFGGLIARVFLSASSVDDALLAVPHHRAAWLALALLCSTFAVGAIWCFVIALGRQRGEYVADALLLGLPAAALGWTAWRARVMWTG